MMFLKHNSAAFIGVEGKISKEGIPKAGRVKPKLSAGLDNMTSK